RRSIRRGGDWGRLLRNNFTVPPVVVVVDDDVVDCSSTILEGVVRVLIFLAVWKPVVGETCADFQVQSTNFSPNWKTWVVVMVSCNGVCAQFIVLRSGGGLFIHDALRLLRPYLST